LFELILDHYLTHTHLALVRVTLKRPLRCARAHRLT
jgi:hypothetical protein